MPHVFANVIQRVRPEDAPSVAARMHDAALRSTNVAPLEIVSSERPRLTADTPGVNVWHDEDGSLVALGATLGSWHWLEVVNVGSYRFPVAPSPRGLEVQAVPHEGVASEVLIDQFYR